ARSWPAATRTRICRTSSQNCSDFSRRKSLDPNWAGDACRRPVLKLLAPWPTQARAGRLGWRRQMRMSVRAETQTQVRAPLAVPRVHSKLVQAQTRLAWILLTPSLVVVSLVALIPLLQTISQSFTNARLASDRPVSIVGLINYVNLVTDTDFLRSIWVTVQFAIVTVVFEFILGLGIAMVVNSNFKGRGFMRAAMLVPWAIITVVSAQMWKWM